METTPLGTIFKLYFQTNTQKNNNHNPDKEQHDGTMVPFLSRNITTKNDVGMVQIIAGRGPSKKGASARQSMSPLSSSWLSSSGALASWEFELVGFNINK